MTAGRSPRPDPPGRFAGAWAGRLLVVIVVLAVVLRVAFVLATADRAPVGDETTYDNIAANLVSGHGYQAGDDLAGRHPTAQRGPSYVLWVAAWYAIAGRGLMVPLLAQAVLDALVCVLSYRLARRWFGSVETGLAAAALYAVYPPFIQFAGGLITESFTNLTVVGAVLAFQSFVASGRVRALVTCALAIGLCALNKPQLLPLCVLLPLAALPAIGRARAVRAALVVTLVSGAVMVPWVVRNAIVFHAFVPGVTGGGIAFWGGTAPIGGHFVGGLGDAVVSDSLRTALGRLDELEQSRWFYRDGMRIIAADPVSYLGRMVPKFFQLWFNLGFENAPSRASLALAAFQVVAIVLAWVGARRGRPDRAAVPTVVVLAVFWTLVNLPFVTQIRYAVPYYAVLFTFTASGAVALLPWTRPRPA